MKCSDFAMSTHFWMSLWGGRTTPVGKFTYESSTLLLETCITVIFKFQRAALVQNTWKKTCLWKFAFLSCFGLVLTPCYDLPGILRNHTLLPGEKSAVCSLLLRSWSPLHRLAIQTNHVVVTSHFSCADSAAQKQAGFLLLKKWQLVIERRRHVDRASLFGLCSHKAELVYVWNVRTSFVRDVILRIICVSVASRKCLWVTRKGFDKNIALMWWCISFAKVCVHWKR